MARGVFTALTVPTAAQLNDCFNVPRCRVRNSADITIATGTSTKLTFNTEDFDYGGMHSTSTNTGRITIPTGGDGTYLIGAQVLWAANGTGIRDINIKLNNTTYLAQNTALTAGAGTTMTMSTSTLVALTATDYIEVEVYQNSGGNLSATAFYQSPCFWATWVAI